MFFVFWFVFFCFFAPLGGSARGSGVSTGPKDIHTHGKRLMGLTEPSPLPKLLNVKFHNLSRSGQITEKCGKSSWLGQHKKSRSIHLQPSPLRSVHSQESLWILEAPESCLREEVSPWRNYRVHV